MKESPLLFSAPMVRAILDGTKTQTRRVVKEKLLDKYHDYLDFACSTAPRGLPSHIDSLPEVMEGKCPYGQPGDRIWVRENFHIMLYCPGYDNGIQENGDHDFADGFASVFYPADESTETFCEFEEKDDEQAKRMLAKNKPSIHMPRWASRITLKIVSIRVERLNQITNEDAKAEGVEPDVCIYGDNGGYPFEGHKYGFKRLWEIINGSGSWSANPWVWVVEFKRI